MEPPIQFREHHPFMRGDRSKVGTAAADKSRTVSAVPLAPIGHRVRGHSLPIRWITRAMPVGPIGIVTIGPIGKRVAVFGIVAVLAVMVVTVNRWATRVVEDS